MKDLFELLDRIHIIYAYDCIDHGPESNWKASSICVGETTMCPAEIVGENGARWKRFGNREKWSCNGSTTKQTSHRTFVYHLNSWALVLLVRWISGICCFFFSSFYLLLFCGVYVSHSIDHDPKWEKKRKEKRELNAFVSIFSLELSMHTTLFDLCRLWSCHSIDTHHSKRYCRHRRENRFCRLVNKLLAASVLNLSSLYPIDDTRIEHSKHTLS